MKRQRNLKVSFGYSSHGGEWPVPTFTADSYGHVAEYDERLLKGDGLDHQIPDCRVDRQQLALKQISLA